MADNNTCEPAYEEIYITRGYGHKMYHLYDVDVASYVSYIHTYDYHPFCMYSYIYVYAYAC